MLPQTSQATDQEAIMVIRTRVRGWWGVGHRLSGEGDRRKEKGFFILYRTLFNLSPLSFSTIVIEF